MAALPQEQHLLRMTEAEYLQFRDEQPIRFEFVNGKVYAMIGSSLRRNMICSNVITSLNSQLRDKD